MTKICISGEKLSEVMEQLQKVSDCFCTIVDTMEIVGTDEEYGEFLRAATALGSSMKTLEGLGKESGRETLRCQETAV